MKNIKVSTRLQAGFGLLTAFMLVLAAIALYGLSELDASLDGIARVNNEETRLANELRSSIQDRAIALRNLALISDPRDVALEAERMKKQDQLYADAFQQLARMFAEEPGTAPKERSLLDQIKQDEAAAIAPQRKAMDLALAHDTAGAMQELLQNARPPQRVWLARAIELAALEDQQNKEARENSVATYAKVRTMVAVIAGIAVLLGIVTAALISRSILRQLGGEPSAAQEMAAQIAEGNLTVSVLSGTRRSDEFDGFSGGNAREAHVDCVRHQNIGGVDFRGRRRDRARQSGSLATHRGTSRIAAGNRGQHGRTDLDRAQQHR